jgi:hypothetical protein
MHANCRSRAFKMIVLSVMGILSISACTSRSLYEDARQDARTACLSQPLSIDRDKCLDRKIKDIRLRCPRGLQARIAIG